MAQDNLLVIGVVAADGIAPDLADDLADDLAIDLCRRFDGADWRAEVAHAPPVDPTASGREMVDTVRRHMLDRGWDLGIGLTELPLRAGGRPVSAYASATHGVGLVSVPAIGGVGLRPRLRCAVVRLVEGVLGESIGRDGGRSGRDTRMGDRLRELGSPIGRARTLEDDTVRFTTAVIRGNLGLLAAMIRANRPLRLLARLSLALLAALGTAAVVLPSSNFWTLADGMGAPRLTLLAAVSLAVIVVALVLGHGLWERADTLAARERVILFNVATVATVATGVAALYVALFAIDLLAGVLLIPPDQMKTMVQHPAGAETYLKLVWLVASLATVGGALGSLVESDDAVRAATYSSRADARRRRRRAGRRALGRRGPPPARRGRAGRRRPARVRPRGCRPRGTARRRGADRA
jgi:hypothetical protein